MGKNSPGLSANTMNFLILQALESGPLHGFGIGKWVRVTTDDALNLEEGSLYPALHRLEQRGLLESIWSTSENNRRARYYRLTEAGKAQLAAEHQHWVTLSQALNKVAAAQADRGRDG